MMDELPIVGSKPRLSPTILVVWVSWGIEWGWERKDRMMVRLEFEKGFNGAILLVDSDDDDDGGNGLLHSFLERTLCAVT